ncbi:Hypothetical protein CINCED_3A009252 [Cinara cedri]|uniref:Alpha-tubulin N-acetyltransferase n=1 Tax=Cinara cedri TaxID=506608 RepID=A0A5E4N3J2_9HEMI|nr:Hypothetical protein CINCED_3A009252 [Cinara cedri]
MEFRFNINNAVATTVQILKIDNTLTAEGYEKNVDLQNIMGLIIDEMGKASALAQNLTLPITSANKLVNSNHIIYMMTEHNTPGHFTVIGILKMGWKKLYFYDKMGLRSDAMVYCLLDFYVHESRQHKSYGKSLIDFMLQDIHLSAKLLAFEKPSEKLLHFMWKHFQLSKLVNQGNNIFTYEEFFDNAFKAKNLDNHRCQESACNCQFTFGQNEVQKHQDTMSRPTQNLHGYTDFPKPKYNYGTDFANNKFQQGNLCQPENVGAYPSSLMDGQHGRHDAHKHHDTMGRIVQGESNAAFGKFKYNQDTFFVEDQFKGLNPHHHANTSAFQTAEDGHMEKRELKSHYNTAFVEDQFRGFNPHHANTSAFQTAEDGHMEKRDLKSHYNTTL